MSQHVRVANFTRLSFAHLYQMPVIVTPLHRHCERSAAIQSRTNTGLPRCARKDGMGSFQGPLVLRRGQGPWLGIVINRNEGEQALGHFDNGFSAIPRRDHFQLDPHRGAAPADNLSID